MLFYFMRRIFFLFIAAIFCIAFNNKLVAQADTHHAITEAHSTDSSVAEHNAPEHKESPVDKIMHHIADANQFHVVTFNGQHIYFPLPCIIYNRSTGKLDAFMSTQLAHGKTYNGYQMHHDRVMPINEEEKTFDFSITKNVFSMLLGVSFLMIILFLVKNAYTRNPNKAPKGIQALIEPIISYIDDDVIKPNLPHKHNQFRPYLLSVFFFILVSNLLGLIPFFPGSANVSGNISFTLTLAAITFILTNVFGNKHYWGHIFAMPGVPKFVLLILTPVEILGMFTKPFSLMMRLFGNITAGHIVVLSLVSLIFILGDNGNSIPGALVGTGFAIPFVLFMSALELLVAFLQAFIFTLLSAIFIGMAVEDNH